LRLPRRVEDGERARLLPGARKGEGAPWPVPHWIKMGCRTYGALVSFRNATYSLAGWAKLWRAYGAWTLDMLIVWLRG